MATAQEESSINLVLNYYFLSIAKKKEKEKKKKRKRKRKKRDVGNGVKIVRTITTEDSSL
jgi:hypothetical protein